MKRRLQISIWERFCRLLVIEETKNRHNNRIIVCKCDCWKLVNATPYWLIIWWQESCWCKQYEDMKINNTKHWFSWGWKWKQHKIYLTYYNILNRCNNVNNKEHKNYWSRWIKCLWKKFEEFRDDMYESYLKHVEEFWEKNTEIDRIDVDWNYCKENCRWVTEREQSRNKRTNCWLIYNWERLCVKDVATKLWVNSRRLHKLYNIYWDNIDVLLSKI